MYFPITVMQEKPRWRITLLRYKNILTNQLGNRVVVRMRWGQAGVTSVSPTIFVQVVKDDVAVDSPPPFLYKNTS
jgi:hypothetical protein